MKIETQPQENRIMKITVEVDPETVEQAQHRAAREIARRTKIPGFRPGKAPYNVVLRMVGAEAIFEESLEHIVTDLYPKMIEEAKIEPSGPGQLEDIVNREPLTLEFSVPLEPEIELSDYRSIRFPYELAPIPESDVDEVLEDLRQRQAVEESVQRAAQEGDRVFFKVSGKRLLPDPDEPESILEGQRHSLIASSTRSETENEWPYPGISNDLIGLSAGEEKISKITFPEDYRFESLQGKDAEFQLSVEEVKARTLPELNDELAQTAGDFETLEALRKDIRTSLEQQARDTYNAQYDDEVIDQLIETSTIQYPPQMLEQEIDEVIHQLEHRLEAQKLDLPTYLKTQNMDEAALRKEATPVAENRLKRSIVLLKVSEAEGIEVKPEELQKETERTLEAMTRFMSESELRKLGPQKVIPGLVSNIAAELRITKTIEKLRRIASGQAEADMEATPAVEESTEAADTLSSESLASENMVSEGAPESITPDSVADEEKLTAEIAEETESVPEEIKPEDSIPAEDPTEITGE